MKRLIPIALAGGGGVLTIAFLAKAGINMVQGRPIAHVTGVAAVLLRDGFIVLILFAILFACFIAYGVWPWLNPDQLWWRREWWKNK